MEKVQRLDDTTAYGRLMLTLLSGFFEGGKIKDIIKEANISPTMYYTLMRDPNFIEQYKNATDKEIKGMGANVLRRVYYDAMQGKWKQQEAILKLAGYIDKEDKITVLHQYDKEQLLEIIGKKLASTDNPTLADMIDADYEQIE